jgi:hypothetical protein
MKKDFIKITGLILVIIILISAFFIFSKKAVVRRNAMYMPQESVDKFTKMQEEVVSFPVNEISKSCTDQTTGYLLDDTNVSFDVPSGYIKSSLKSECKFSKNYGGIETNITFSAIDAPTENTAYSFTLIGDIWFGFYKNKNFVNDLYDPPLIMDNYVTNKNIRVYSYSGGDVLDTFDTKIIPLNDHNWAKVTFTSSANTEKYTGDQKEKLEQDKILLENSITIN